MMSERIGFIGLGPMGGGMARRLVGGGKSLTVCDLNPNRLKALTDLGAQGAASAAEVPRRCDIVFTSLPSAHTFATVAENDLLPNARQGQVFIDVGTSLIKDSRRLAKMFAEKG